MKKHIYETKRRYTCGVIHPFNQQILIDIYHSIGAWDTKINKSKQKSKNYLHRASIVITGEGF